MTRQSLAVDPLLDLPMGNYKMGDTNEPMRKPRWRSFSLRTLLVGVTVLCVWLAWWLSAAKKQREVADWVRSFNCIPYYSYQVDARGWPDPNDLQSPIPKWLEDRLGVDFFYSIQQETHRLNIHGIHFKSFRYNITIDLQNKIYKKMNLKNLVRIISLKP